MLAKRTLVLVLMALLAVSVAYAQDQNTQPCQTTQTTVQPCQPCQPAPTCPPATCPPATTTCPPATPPCPPQPTCGPVCEPVGQGPAAPVKVLKWSITASAYWPTDGDTASDLGSTWFDIALGYKLPLIPSIPADQEIAIGYIAAPGKTFTNSTTGVSVDTNAWMVPLTYTLRTIPTADRGFYYGAGAGIYFTNVKAENVETGNNVSESSTKAGVSVLGGYKWNRTWGAELGYTFIFGDTQGLNLSGFALGLRAEF